MMQLKGFTSNFSSMQCYSEAIVETQPRARLAVVASCSHRVASYIRSGRWLTNVDHVSFTLGRMCFHISLLVISILVASTTVALVFTNVTLQQGFSKVLPANKGYDTSHCMYLARRSSLDDSHPCVGAFLGTTTRCRGSSPR